MAEERAGWDPALYRRFEDQRTRPARDLLAQIGLDAPVRAVDLGCGPGNSTELLVRRWPGAIVEGLDNDAAMLAEAGHRLPGVRFADADIATWRPDTPPDVIFANASLQWVPDHAALLPRLLEALAPGGVLAIQMPDNRDEPTHRLMREVASEPPFAVHFPDMGVLRTAVLSVPRYHDLLAVRAAAVDAWRTVYHHPLASATAIVDWVRGTGLRPFVDRLPADLRPAYLAEYTRRIDAAYPARADGRRLLAFPRMFLVAHRGERS